MYEPDVLRLMALSAIRKLWPQRHCERWGADARHALRQWLRTLRGL